MEEEIKTLCPKVWEVLDVKEENFINGWRKIEEIAKDASSIPLGAKLWIAGAGYYDPAHLSTLTKDRLEDAESFSSRKLSFVGKTNSCGRNHGWKNCGMMIKCIWGEHGQHRIIKPGYKNVLLSIAEEIKGRKKKDKLLKMIKKENNVQEGTKQAATEVQDENTNPIHVEDTSTHQQMQEEKPDDSGTSTSTTADHHV